MQSQKVITGLLFTVLVGAGVFFYFHFSFLNIVVNQMEDFFPSFFRGAPEEKGDMKEGEEERKGLVREEDGDIEGFLTREGIIEETNIRRGEFEDNLLRENSLLNEIAEEKLDDMFAGQYFEHISPEGIGVGDIAKEMGYEFLLIGDNLAKGNYRDDEDVVGAWMNSPGHRKNILDGRYKEIGVAARKGHFEGRELWLAVQVFGMPTSACPGVDRSLLVKVEEKKERAEFLETRREELKREIDSIERGSSEHISKVEEYNTLVREYNALIISLKDLIDEYNRQLQLQEECVRG